MANELAKKRTDSTVVTYLLTYLLTSTLCWPAQGLAIDAGGNLYIADSYYNVVWKVKYASRANHN